MSAIRFSHRYNKMPAFVLDGKTILLDVYKTTTEDLCVPFINFDTQYFNEQYEPRFYPLPPGEILVLLLMSEDLTDKEVWTTIRRWTPRKEQFYKSKRGEEFTIEITGK